MITFNNLNEMLSICFYVFIFLSAQACGNLENSVSSTKRGFSPSQVRCQKVDKAQASKIAKSYVQFKKQVDAISIDTNRKIWNQTGIVRIPLDVDWIETSINRLPKEKWIAHPVGVSDDLALEKAFPSRLYAPLIDLKKKIFAITEHTEYGFTKHFQARKWKNEGVLKQKALKVFGDANLAYPWHKDPRFGSALITLRGKKGTQYIEPRHASDFEIIPDQGYMPLIYREKAGVDPTIQEASVGELLIIAGRHSATNGRHIIHRSPPNADPDDTLTAEGRLILILELI